jgi:hypothetical protein
LVCPQSQRDFWEQHRYILRLPGAASLAPRRNRLLHCLRGARRQISRSLWAAPHPLALGWVPVQGPSGPR